VSLIIFSNFYETVNIIKKVLNQEKKSVQLENMVKVIMNIVEQYAYLNENDSGLTNTEIIGYNTFIKSEIQKIINPTLPHYIANPNKNNR